MDHVLDNKSEEWVKIKTFLNKVLDVFKIQSEIQMYHTEFITGYAIDLI